MQHGKAARKTSSSPANIASSPANLANLPRTALTPPRDITTAQSPKNPSPLKSKILVPVPNAATKASTPTQASISSSSVAVPSKASTPPQLQPIAPTVAGTLSPKVSTPTQQPSPGAAPKTTVIIPASSPANNSAIGSAPITSTSSNAASTSSGAANSSQTNTAVPTTPEELPPDREKNVARREGFAYQLITIEHQKGCKFGLGIKHYQNKVIVSRVDEGSISAKCLVAGDRVIDVDGQPVSDKDVARDLLLKALQKTRKVTLIVERAVSDDAIAQANAVLIASEQQPASVAMASDIREIVARQKERMTKAQCGPGGGGIRKGIMRKSGSTATAGKVHLNEEKKEHIIASDNEGKALKKVTADSK